MIGTIQTSKRTVRVEILKNTQKLCNLHLQWSKDMEVEMKPVAPAASELKQFFSDYHNRWKTVSGLLAGAKEIRPNSSPSYCLGSFHSSSWVSGKKACANILVHDPRFPCYWIDSPVGVYAGSDAGRGGGDHDGNSDHHSCWNSQRSLVPYRERKRWVKSQGRPIWMLPELLLVDSPVPWKDSRDIVWVPGVLLRHYILRAYLCWNPPRLLWATQVCSCYTCRAVSVLVGACANVPALLASTIRVPVLFGWSGSCAWHSDAHQNVWIASASSASTKITASWWIRL